MAWPDPKDLPRRAHALRWEGEPDRRSTRLLPIVMAWLQQRFLEIDVEGPLAPATPAWMCPARVTRPVCACYGGPAPSNPLRPSAEFEGARSLPGRLFIDEESEQPHQVCSLRVRPSLDVHEASRHPSGARTSHRIS